MYVLSFKKVSPLDHQSLHHLDKNAALQLRTHSRRVGVPTKPSKAFINLHCQSKSKPLGDSLSTLPTMQKSPLQYAQSITILDAERNSPSANVWFHIFSQWFVCKWCFKHVQTSATFLVTCRCFLRFCVAPCWLPQHAISKMILCFAESPTRNSFKLPNHCNFYMWTQRNFVGKPKMILETCSPKQK